MDYDQLDDYRLYIHKSRYARFLDDKSRRENWDETVQRLIDFYNKKFPQHTEVLNNDIKNAIINMEVMPSMRSLMTAGPALERDNISGFNCSYIAVDHIKAFSESLFILMNGTGLGFSVERQYIAQLPIVAEDFYESETVISVKDSKLGWATALHELVSLLYQGRIPKWDLSKLRPAGARLKTFGGRSSGPGPLDELFRFCVTTFKKAAGRRLTSLEVHDFMCKIGAIVVVGGVRRCLPGDTLVQVGPNEWKQIANMAVGDRIYLDGEYQNVTNFFEQGKQEVMKINLEDGGYLESTAAHRWLVKNNQTDEFEWVRTDELTDNYSMVNPNEYTE
jgi:hypothetical protein